jgi:hypothetical protein
VSALSCLTLSSYMSCAAVLMCLYARKETLTCGFVLLLPHFSCLHPYLCCTFLHFFLSMWAKFDNFSWENWSCTVMWTEWWISSKGSYLHCSSTLSAYAVPNQLCGQDTYMWTPKTKQNKRVNKDHVVHTNHTAGGQFTFEVRYGRPCGQHPNNSFNSEVKR